MSTQQLTGRRSRRAFALCAAAAAAVTFAAYGGTSHAASTPGEVKGLFGTLPATGTPTKGGTITVGQLTGSTPTYIFPIVPSANASVYGVVQFIYNMYLPLYNGPIGGTPTINYDLSLASKPTFSNGDKTVTIHMKKGFKWSNGKPVTADDLVFDVDLVNAAVKESPANFSAFTPGQFPQSMKSIKATDKYTVVIQLKRSWNPSFFLNDQLQGNYFPMPSTDWNIAAAGGAHLDYTKPANAKKIFDYLHKIGGDVAGFGTNPLWKIADGPFQLASFNSTNSSYDWVANKNYGGSPKPSIDKLNVETFTGITPTLNALRTGSVDVAGIDFSQLNAVPGLRSSGYSVFGYPNLGWFGAFINFKDHTGHFSDIVKNLYVRQAFAMLEDQPAYLTGIFKNAGVKAYGPVPTVPPTPFTPPNAVNTPYPFNPAKAVALLKSHGWNVVPNGQTTCAKAGSGPGECGAGIPKGTPFKFTWYYIPASETPSASLESEAFASEAKQAAGINIQLQSKTFNYLIANFNDADPSVKKNQNLWGVMNFGGFTDAYYPTQKSIFNTTGVYNIGGYSDPTADKLINNSVFSSDPKAVVKEASYLTNNIPVLFFPNTDLIWAVSNKVGGTSQSFLALTQYALQAQYWYLHKQ
jgi:peptide/nickel transport system substrate-binding protein